MAVAGEEVAQGVAVAGERGAGVVVGGGQQGVPSVQGPGEEVLGGDDEALGHGAHGSPRVRAAGRSRALSRAIRSGVRVPDRWVSTISCGAEAGAGGGEDEEQVRDRSGGPGGARRAGGARGGEGGAEEGGEVVAEGGVGQDLGGVQGPAVPGEDAVGAQQAGRLAEAQGLTVEVGGDDAGAQGGHLDVVAGVVGDAGQQQVPVQVGEGGRPVEGGLVAGVDVAVVGGGEAAAGPGRGGVRPGPGGPQHRRQAPVRVRARRWWGEQVRGVEDERDRGRGGARAAVAPAGGHPGRVRRDRVRGWPA